MGVMCRFLIGASVVVVLVMVIIGLTGTLPWAWAAGSAASLIAAEFGVLLLIRMTSDGFAEITETHLIVRRTRGNQERYRLTDIGAVRLKRAYWGRVPYVELQLRRSLVLGVWTETLGTGIIGVPSLFLRRARVPVEDTEGFAQALSRRLKPVTDDE